MGDTISPPPSERRKRRKLTTHQNKSSASSDAALISIYSFNVNGISPFIQNQPAITKFFTAKSRPSPPPSGDLRAVLRRYDWPTMLFLQEVKINPNDTASQRAVEKAVQRSADEEPEAPAYKATFCLPRDKHNARGTNRQIYGVCSLIREDFFNEHVERVREVDWDAEGRFLVCETKATDSVPKMAILNIYAVNGTDSPCRDTETGKVSGTRHDRKLQVHSLLQAECRTLEDEDFAIILAGDLNIARTPLDGHPNLRTYPKQHCTNRSDFERRFFGRASLPADADAKSRTNAEADTSTPGLDMVDTFRHLHPDRKGYTYYPRGKKFGDSCDRVDMILVSRSLEGNLVDAGMHETSVDRATSDHVPLFASFRFPKERSEVARTAE